MKRVLIVAGVAVALYLLPVPHNPIAYVLLLLWLAYNEVVQIRKSVEQAALNRTDKSENQPQS